MNVRYGIIFLVVATVFAIGQVNSEEANAETMVRREADPGMGKALAKALKMISGMGKRSPEPIDAKAIIALIKKRMGKKGRSADPMNIERERRNPDPSILDVITDLVNKAMDATG